MSFIGYIFPPVDSNPVTNQEASIDVLMDTCNNWKCDLMHIWARSKLGQCQVRDAILKREGLGLLQDSLVGIGA